ncbi:hypothetical protein LRP88_11854 [Fusarium phalaenopsidis]
MSVPQQYYLHSEAYQKYLDNELRPTKLLKPIKEGPVDLAPGEVFCRWQDAENGLMCSQYDDIAANKKPSWPMNTDTDTTPAETQAAPASDVATSEVETQNALAPDFTTPEAEHLQRVEFDELDMTGDEYIWGEAWAAFDETAL